MAQSTSAASSRSPSRPRPRLWGDLVTLVVIFGLLSLVYLLPADTSLSQVQANGRIVACLPNAFPPLVTRDAEQPGYDVELLTAIAGKLGVRFASNTNSAMGRDFNPRNWRVNRAQCQLLAGGVVLSPSVRSFLDTVPTPLGTGWAVVSPDGLDTLEGRQIGFFAGLTGLDRIGLGRYLRQQGLQARVVQSIAELEEGLASGTLDAGISEVLTAQQLAGANDWSVQSMPDNLERYQLGIGLWRGDMTLLRAVEDALADLESEGFFDALAEKYDIAPIEGTIAAPG